MERETKISETGSGGALRLSDENLKSEHTFEALIEHCTDGVGILSEEGKFLYHSSSVKNLLGYSTDEIQQIRLFNLAHPDDVDSLTNAIKSVLAQPGKSVKDHTVQLLHKNESWRCIEAAFKNMLHDPSINGIVFNFRDITDQQQAAKKLHRLNRLYTFISQINQAISHASNEQEFLKNACDISIETGKFKAAWIGKLNADTGQIEMMEQAGMLPETAIKYTDVAADYREAQRSVMRSGNSFVCNTAECITTALEMGFGSFIVLPLKKSDSVIGTFNLFAADINFFTTEEIKLLEEATLDLSYALETLERLAKKRKRVQALQKTEANLQAIVNSTSEGFILIDKEAIVLEFNNYAKNTISLNSKTDIRKGKLFFDFLPENRKEDYRAHFKKVLLGETVNFEICYGSSWFSFTISPVYDLEVVEGICLSYKEITEKKIDEKKLRDSELFNKDILASLSSHILVIEADGTLVASNKAWNDFASEQNPVTYPETSGDSNYFTICKSALSLNVEELKQTKEGILSVFQKGSPSFQMEFSCRHKSQEQWFLLNVLPFGQDDTKVVISHQDITERKIAENTLSNTSVELQKTLSELNKILDSSLDVICTINSNFEFVNVNIASQTVLGYSPQELIGTSFMNLVYEKDVEITQQVAENIFEGHHVPVFENRYVHKNGTIVPLLWSVHYITELDLVYCIAKDVTEKKKLEKAIENERDQFYDMLLKAPSAIGMLKGADHVFEMANPLYLHLTGKEDVIGKTVAEVFPEIIDQGYIQMLDQVYQTGEAYTGNEMLAQVDIEGNGTLTDFYMDFVYQAYRNNNGAIKGVFFFINNITHSSII